eukprot:m.279720 g.279720  ORF g.279720 m.279720 type:complete len:70 (-) comp16323_c11_seq47:18-227(-)
MVAFLVLFYCCFMCVVALNIAKQLKLPTTTAMNVTKQPLTNNNNHLMLSNNNNNTSYQTTITPFSIENT